MMHPVWATNATNPGVSDAAISAWNARTGRELPNVLATLLRQHNGGTLEYFDTDWELLSLDEIKAVDARFLKEVWQMHETMEEWREELADSGISPDAVLYTFAFEGNTVFWFAWLDDATGPVVIDRHWDDLSFSVGRPLDEWCRKFLAPVPSPQPGVSWNDVHALDVIFEEKCLRDGCIQLHQVLGRKNGHLWFYTHEIEPHKGTVDEEKYSKHLLPQPFDSNQCGLFKELGNWCLPLTPVKSGNCVEYVSRRSAKSGGWHEKTNPDSDGAQVESPDRAKIEVLRAMLFSPKAVARADQKARREKQLWGDRDGMLEMLTTHMEKFAGLSEEDIMRDTALVASLQETMQDVRGKAAHAIEMTQRMAMRLIPHGETEGTLLAAIQQHCREHRIVEPPGLTTRTPENYAVVRRDGGNPRIVARTWKTLDEASAYVRGNPPAENAGALEILDFSTRNRYRWTNEGPVLSGDF